jgi:hypothetical protein
MNSLINWLMGLMILPLVNVIINPINQWDNLQLTPRDDQLIGFRYVSKLLLQYE